jgi:hypothetical protein
MIMTQVGELRVENVWTWFKTLPLDQRIISFDARHASARSSKHSTFEVLVSINNQPIFVFNIDTDSTTKNAWLNEDYAMKFFFDKCVKENVHLHMVCHDQCKSASKFINEYNNAMALKDDTFQACIDANDNWHGKKSILTEWKKNVATAEPRLSGTDECKADDEITVEHKRIAARQLANITPIVEKRFLAACNKVL